MRKEFLSRSSINEKLWKKLKKLEKLFESLPFIEGIFITGSLARFEAKENSDIDFLVITQKRRIFTARFFLDLFLRIFREKRTPQNFSQKICLNHFLEKENLEISQKSLFSAYVYFFSRPFLERNNIYRKFKQKNLWAQSFIPFWKKEMKSPIKVVKKNLFAKFLEKILEGKIGNYFEKIQETIQKKRAKFFKKKFKKGIIYLSSKEIILHLDSKQKEIEFFKVIGYKNYCPSSSEEEQTLRKRQVVGSSPTSG